MHRYATGFTLIELVVVLVLLGIVATYVAPRFTGLGGYSELTAQNNIQQALRYAQQLAMSQTNQIITFTTNSTTN
jgi:prepilin-type N-terminal cleavage/methylation domain-containing protein